MLPANLTKIIENSVLSGKINHCYLLKTYQGVNLDEIILYMIKSFSGLQLDSLEQNNYSNIIVADASKISGSGIKKDEISEIFESSYFTDYLENNQKIIVFKNIEQASHIALNSLLKTIEEPNNNVIFILTTTKINQLLSTIKSRSFIININKQNNDELEKQFIAIGFQTYEAWFFSNIFSDINDLIEKRSFYTFEKVSNLLDVFKKSFNNPSILGVFLGSMNKKEFHEDLFFAVNALKFIISWNWLNQNNINKHFSQYLKTFKKVKFNFVNAFLACDKFLSSISTNVNIFLQIQALIVNLMECYE